MPPKRHQKSGCLTLAEAGCGTGRPLQEARKLAPEAEGFPPDASKNPPPGSYYPRHIGFLGGAAPAVSGLSPVRFAEGDEAQLVEIAFSLEEAAESTASLMRSVREFFIEKFGLESANQAVPEYHVRWIEEAGNQPIIKGV